MLTLTEQPGPSTPQVSTELIAPLRLLVGAAVRSAVPVTVGIPVGDSSRRHVTSLRVLDPTTGWTAPCQLAWSPQRDWLRATFLSPPELTQNRDLLLQSGSDFLVKPLVVQHQPLATSIDTGCLQIAVRGGTDRMIDQISAHAFDLLQPAGVRLQVTDAASKTHSPRWRSSALEQVGPLQAVLRRDAQALGLRITSRWSFYSGTSLVRCELTIHNPRRAKHPGGYWDLGDPGSIWLREIALNVDLALKSPATIHWQEHRDAAVSSTGGGAFSLHQESSGGDQWRSANHVNRNGQVPLRFRGYRVKTAEVECSGMRANAVVCIGDHQRYVACAVEDFWQKFPTAIHVDRHTLSIKLWPGDWNDLHELQAGECCTRVIWLDFSPGKAEVERLAWIYDPPLVTVDAGSCEQRPQLPYFPAADSSLRPEHRQILDEAIAGPHSFFAKREAIDEYSWRNYGDVWADHEEAYADDPRPVISHYNNQYDLLHGLLIEYLRSSDRRWWLLADPLARHVIDIDVYRTDRDKPAYNQGLFWHTAHYHAVGRATHRSMSNDMRGKRIPAPGTGPGNEHNYTSGLTLYHHLTGCPRARQTVIGLAEWVLAMDDGRRHLLGLLSPHSTGLASCTTDPEYHGPGRGAANSIQTLLNAWKLTADDRYIDYSAALIRRTVHPQDDIAGRQLGNAELRWSYTVYLQALDRFLLETEGVARCRPMRAYARESLLHYARWIAEHEKFYLDEPEKLEYPTETWAAQELRKGTTLLMAARYAIADEAIAWRRRGEAILDRAWEKLLTFESRTCTRPLALVLQQGPLEAGLRCAGSLSQQLDQHHDFGSPAPFQTQKQQIRSLRGSPLQWLGAANSILDPWRWFNVASQLWFTERVRRYFD